MGDKSFDIFSLIYTMFGGVLKTRIFVVKRNNMTLFLVHEQLPRRQKGKNGLNKCKKPEINSNCCGLLAHPSTPSSSDYILLRI